MVSGIRNLNNDEKASYKAPDKAKKEKKKSKTNRTQSGLAPVEEVSHFLENIKLDWRLFWAGIAGEEELKDEDPFETGKLEALSIEQVKQVTRALSLDRKKINQRMEQIHRDIDDNNQRLESIQLVGGDHSAVLEEINKLNECGLKLSLELEKVSQQLDRFRTREDELKGLR